MPALSISIAGLARDASRPWSGAPKRAISWVASTGARMIQLDATQPGWRARELDRSARRDLAAAIRRAGLRLSGLDLWIPSKHFVDPAQQARAMDAVSGATALAAELSALNASPGVNVSVILPADVPDDISSTLAHEAERAGVRLAGHAFPVAESGQIGVGVDPAVVLLAGADPIDVVAQLGARVAAARLSDADEAGRVPPGDGRLDVQAYLATLDVVGAQSAIVDLRSLGDVQERTALAVVDAWGE